MIFEETLTQLKVSLANPVNRVSPLKEAIQVAKAKLSLAFYENSNISMIIKEYSNFISEVLGLAWDEFSWVENDKSWRKSRISLLAVGGFGRRELLPHSDIDILILLERNDVHLIESNLIISSKSFSNLIHLLKNHFLDNETLSVSRFKEITGLTRKNAIPILEYLDKCNYTIRNGMERVKGDHSFE